MAELIECRTCGEMFDPATKKSVRGGFIDECVFCSRRRNERMYLGRTGCTGKGESVEIYRDNLDFYKTALKRECGAGMNPNLGISSTINPIGRSIKGDKE